MNPRPLSGFVNPLLLCTLVGLGASGGVGVGAVWLQHQISISANENKALETRITALERESEQLTTEIAEETDQAVLLQRSERWHLGLAAPAQDRVQIITGNAVQDFLRGQARPAERAAAANPFFSLAPRGGS